MFTLLSTTLLLILVFDLTLKLVDGMHAPPQPHPHTGKQKQPLSSDKDYYSLVDLSFLIRILDSIGESELLDVNKDIENLLTKHAEKVLQNLGISQMENFLTIYGEFLADFTRKIKNVKLLVFLSGTEILTKTGTGSNFSSGSRNQNFS
uniref:Uncharacterized protein n=1 Tax=Meloidogyne enterolobii TaxID=390850 RepID=A0A6V7Y0R7_MELEN|nr:unnamed protein product [Meloidogyne enterolobii]